MFLDFIKNEKVKKVGESGFFSKGLVHGFGQKYEIFPPFYFRLNRPGKCVCLYSRKEKGVFRPSNHRLKKLEILVLFFPKLLLHGFGQKFEFFPIFNFKGKIGQENVFDDILERKEAS